MPEDKLTRRELKALAAEKKKAAAPTDTSAGDQDATSTPAATDKNGKLSRSQRRVAEQGQRKAELDAAAARLVEQQGVMKTEKRQQKRQREKDRKQGVLKVSDPLQRGTV
jgi:hypothetical protein